MAGRYGDLNYGRLTKGGVLTGVILFVVGVVAEYGSQTVGGVPESLDTVFLTMEFLGPLIALLSVILFGVALPLTE